LAAAISRGQISCLAAIAESFHQERAMFSRRLAAVTFLLIPSIASAQRRVRGERKEDWSDIGTSVSLKLSNRDVENISPVKLLIEKRKDLKLSEEQLKQVKEMEARLKEKNDSLFKVLDLLRRDMKSPPGTPTDAERARMSSARRELAPLIEAFRANYAAAEKDALPILDEEQQKTASELLAKQRSDAEGMLADKVGGGGARDGASRRGKPPTV
jgi:hypothetical protein